MLTQSFDHHELLLIYDLYNNVYPSLIEYIKDVVRSCESGDILDAIQELEKAVSELAKTKIKREEFEKEKTELEKLEDELSKIRENINESRASFNKIIKVMCETLEIGLKSDYEIDLILDSMLRTFSDEEIFSGYEIVGWMQDFSLKLRDGEIDLYKLRVVDSQPEEHVDPEESFLELQKVLSDYTALLLRSAEVYKQSVTLSLTMGTNRITKEIGDSREYISAICTVLAKNSTKEQRSVVEEYLE